MSDPRRCLLPEDEWPAQTPHSRVHATDEEWYDLAKADYERDLFVEVPEDEIFRNNLGDMVLAGAMGVDKVKETPEGPVDLLRFISILCPQNAYFRKLRGESRSLPYLGQLGLVLNGPEDQTLIDSEDLESCFNLYRTNKKSPAFFTFAKKVSQGALGGDPNRMVWIGLTAIPMGWTGAVDVAQSVLRELVFGVAGVDPTTEFRKDRPIPEGDISILCLDGFDFLRRTREALESFAASSSSAQATRFRRSARD